MEIVNHQLQLAKICIQKYKIRDRNTTLTRFITQDYEPSELKFETILLNKSCISITRD